MLRDWDARAQGPNLHFAFSTDNKGDHQYPDHERLDLSIPTGPATDSGYASHGRSEYTSKNDDEDDTRTVFTDNQELDITDDVKERLVAAFSRGLVEKLGTFLSTESDRSTIRNLLDEFLKEYSLRLGINACAGEQKRATTFVRHYRRRIANLIVSSAGFSSATEGEILEDEDEDIASHKEDGITIAEKMHLWHTKKDTEDEGEELLSQNESGVTLTEKTHPEETRNPDAIASQEYHITMDQSDAVDDDDDVEDYAVANYPEAWQFLTSSHAYYWLLSRVRSEMLLSKREGTTAEKIRNEILRGLAAQPKRNGYGQAMSKVKFNISWCFPQFLSGNYPKERNPSISSFITLVASKDNVQALTCGQYMSQVWPVTGPEILSALQGALDKGLGQAYRGNSAFQSCIV
ncbi:hypothetical protein D0Z07_8888 [Hyphodiscus hymeniophilus]|uniref:Uncharacterized protein n=1 Tax=Hyphodiscus hymeniophilus TaxID=353542 RepID=A0A9P6SJT6_9HELO|nr:hypothetical protein D0Z07_8888 [Hyphodiscus hymeniophilus]